MSETAPAPKAAPAPPSTPHALFESGKLRFALPIGAVGEVASDVPLTRLPMPQKGVVGLINLRGDILPAACLDPWFGEATASTVAIPFYLVVKHGAATVALRIDRFEQVVAIPDGAAKPDPAPGPHTNIAPRVWSRPNGSIYCLSAEALIRALQIKKAPQPLAA